MGKIQKTLVWWHALANFISSIFASDSCGAFTMDPVKVIAVGNPGSGKSTVLNSLAGEGLFKNGVNIGKGMLIHTVNGMLWQESTNLTTMCFCSRGLSTNLYASLSFCRCAKVTPTPLHQI